MAPTFLVIGGMKCGTSALHLYLSQQKGVFLPRKNIDFYNDECWPKGRDWYESYFPKSQPERKVIGEISTEYAKFPHRCGAPARIAEVMPDVRLIYLVRHPIKRMISQYIHCINCLLESRPPDLALAPSNSNQYLDFSLYYRQLEQYLSYFSKDQIKLIRSEDLLKKPQETIEGIFEFVGATGPSLVDQLIVHSRKEKRSWNTLGRFIRRSPKRYNLFNYYLKRMPSKLSQLALLSTGRPVVIGELPQDLHKEIIESLSPDLEKLYAFAGDSLVPWDLRKI